MTGLTPAEDVILEVAACVTDAQYNVLDTYESRVSQSTNIVLERLKKNIWWDSFPENRDQFAAQAAEGKPGAAVEKELLALVTKHFPANEPVVLAGNSIHTDRGFVRQWWPALEERLHYRMLDVSAWKVVMQTTYGVEFPKQEKHRALDDILESIAELQFYLQWFKTNH